MTLPPTPFIFIRHGETDLNRDHKSVGEIDIPLNDTGIAQAQAAAKLLAKEHFTKIYASPQVRAKKTAEIIAAEKEKAGTPVPMEIVDDLREATWGEKAGMPRGKWLEDWHQGAHFEGGEDFKDFQERVEKVIHKILGKEQGPVLIVSHRGVYRPIQKLMNHPESDLGNAVPVYNKPHKPKQNTPNQQNTPMAKENDANKDSSYIDEIFWEVYPVDHKI